MQIDKHVPPPPRAYAGRNGRRTSYPFQQMQPGDSVFYPHDGTTVTCPAYLAAATVQKRYPPARFTGRKVIENGVPGIRIWRL